MRIALEESVVSEIFSKEITLYIYEVVGSSLCVTSEDGEKVYEQIATALKDNQKIRLSFKNVKSLTPVFLNAAIGQLYGQFPEEKIRNSISVDDIERDDIALLKLVIDTAKAYFQTPGSFDTSSKEFLEDDNGLSWL